jgi:hypothetical protein
LKPYRTPMSRNSHALIHPNGVYTKKEQMAAGSHEFCDRRGFENKAINGNHMPRFC